MMNEQYLNKFEYLQDARKVAFIDFLATPKQERGMTQYEFAKKIKVTPQTLSEWKKLDGFQEEIVKRVRKNAASRTVNIVEAIAKKAERGNVHAAKLWFQFVLSWSEKERHEVWQQSEVRYIIQRGK